MILRPHLLLYDEPTTGLDPMTCLSVDMEIVKLRDKETVTSVMVTHQLRDAFYVATHEARRKPGGEVELVAASESKLEQADFVMIREGRVAFEGSAWDLRNSKDPYLRTFLS
jgi:phospholipid/cholesterol/gamma-HCH transport system ATP-binding protein